MTDKLTTLLHDTAQRVPTALHPAAELRRSARHHQRVRRTGAGVLAVFMLAGAIGLGTGLGGGGKRAAELPAQRPELTHGSLLIGDELPPPWAAGLHPWKEPTTAEGEPEAVTFCQQGNLKALGADRMLHRLFKTDLVEGRQVVAQFDSPEQATNAFDSARSWFDSCPGVREPIRRWPAYSPAGGQAATFVVARPKDEDEDEVEHVGIGVVDSTVTIVVLAATEGLEGGPAALYVPAGEDADPLRPTMLFALQRLSDDRDVKSNSVPDGFTFAEERDELRDGGSEFPSAFLGASWAVHTCDVNNPPTTSRQSLRTGMRFETFDFWTTEREYVGRSANLQLALYEDEDTARAEAAEVRAAVAACARGAGGSQQELQTAAVGPVDVHVTFHPKYVEGFNEGATATAVVHLGNAVFVASALASIAVDNRDEDALTASALDTVRRAIDNNAKRICEVADCK